MLASDDNLGGGGTNDKLMQAMDLLLNYQTDMTHQSGVIVIRVSTVPIHYWKVWKIWN